MRRQEQRCLLMISRTLVDAVVEPTIFRPAYENAAGIRNMGRDAIRETHAAGVDALHSDPTL
ncbi:hypothetical protein P7D22_08105 [Lichenihabitans sp. Uapishka_5]|uniref:hypothetical protein n=1 Tax=Lichenihabitans sp. Uapishka_5 TaxID=3037302 RepID=UPI0029E81767|nr:hypothetical protein [Lichenihabitans sp. Uapishka_5]MDX7951142.1 hypothetical protein [Lichenihabitans sp. Uapishka_5]